MAWLVNGETIARKVRNPTYGVCRPAESSNFKCLNCGYHIINHGDPWPGLPAGVKFDPSDQDLLKHLAAKVGKGNPHPLIDVFISTLDGEDAVYHTHPKSLPEIRSDGTSTHYFDRPTRAYASGKRKRRRVQQGGDESVSWHKTGKTRSISENGKHLGFKKIMVLYDAKVGKTNWVMHQYDLGLQEEQKENEYVVSKIFYQTQPRGVGIGGNGDTEVGVLEGAEGPSSLVYEFRTNEKMVDVTSPGETPLALVPPVSDETEHRGLLQQLTEDVDRMWHESFPESVPVLWENANMIQGMREARQDAGYFVKTAEMQKDIEDHEPTHNFMTDTQTPQTDGLMRDVHDGTKGNISSMLKERSDERLDTSIPQSENLLNENVDGIKHGKGVESESKVEIDSGSNSLEQVVLGTPPDYLLSTQEAEEVLEDIVNHLSSITDSQKLQRPCSIE